jgi:MFS family permease
MAVRFKSPIAAGVDCLPNTCAFIPGSVIVSMLITRLGRFQWAIWLGWIIATVGGGLFILLDIDTHIIVWVVALMVFGVGSGMVLSSLQISVQTTVRTEECGRAASMYAFMRTLGQVVGVAVGGTVFQNQMAVKLKILALPVDIASNAEQYIVLLRKMTAAERVGPLEAYVSGFKGVFEVLLGISALGLLLSLLIKHHSMDKILESRYRLDR